MSATLSLARPTVLVVHDDGDVLDVKDRDATQDESLDLNCAWYADILMTLTC